MTALLASELLKLRTTRAPWGLALALLAISGLAVAGALGPGSIDERERALSVADAAEASSFFALVLGILLVTNEHRHGTITATFLVTPARERVLAAKLLVAALGGLAAGVAVAALALALALPWLESRGEPLALDGDLVAAGARLLVAYALAGALGAAVGSVVRSQVGALVATFVWLFILEPIVSVLPVLAEAAGLVDDAGDDPLGRYLPGGALDALVSTPEQELLSFPNALLAAAGYVVAIALAGIFLTRRRDVD